MTYFDKDEPVKSESIKDIFVKIMKENEEKLRKMLLGDLVKPTQLEKLPEKHVFQKCPLCGFEVMFDDGVVVYCRICGHVIGHEHWQYKGKMEIGRQLHVPIELGNMEDLTKVAVFCKQNNIKFRISVLTKDL